MHAFFRTQLTQPHVILIMPILAIKVVVELSNLVFNAFIHNTLGLLCRTVFKGQIKGRGVAFSANKAL